MDSTTLSELLGSLVSSGSTRPYASAGGFYAVELYALMGLDPVAGNAAVMHFLGSPPSLEMMWESSQLRAVFPTQEWIYEAALLLVATANMTPYCAKYGARGYRFASFEVGAVLQLIDGRASDLDLSTCWIGGFDDSALNNILGLTAESNEVAMACMAIGYS